jgi:hypothetical protein
VVWYDANSHIIDDQSAVVPSLFPHRYWYNQWDFGWYRRYKRNYAPGWNKPSKGMYGRRLQQQQQQQQNETILLPPCLLGSHSYSNTCKQCNYTNVSVALTVNVTRSGVISQLGQNHLGFVAPGIAVTPGGSIVIVTSYSGPAQHPNSTLPAYPGESDTCSVGVRGDVSDTLNQS